MGLFSGGKGGAGGTPKQKGAQTIHSVLGPSSRIDGVANFTGPVRIDGAFEGSLEVGETLVIGGPGELTGDVRARSVVVCGTVRGTITASESVELQKGARVEGDVWTRTFIVEAGVFFHGHCHMEAVTAVGEASSSARLPRFHPEPAVAAPAESKAAAAQPSGRRPAADSSAPGRSGREASPAA
ncbi:MAG: polymer-forming cytoskeletal protein [Gemmatimonadota bacterium]